MYASSGVKGVWKIRNSYFSVQRGPEGQRYERVDDRVACDADDGGDGEANGVGDGQFDLDMLEAADGDKN